MPNTHSSRPKRIAAWASLLPLQLFAQVSPMADDAWQLLRQGDVAQAEATFGALIGRSATDPDPWLGRGLSRSRLQQWDLAAQDLEKAIALAQGYVPVPIRSEPSTIPATQGSVPAASLNAALPAVPQRQAEAEAGAAPGYRWALSASAGATR